MSPDFQVISANKAGGAHPKIESLNQMKISVISDIHLLPENMIAHNEAFLSHLNKDRKLLEESQALLEAALEKVADNGSQVLLIAGDLTKDGELEGHLQLARTLKQFKTHNPNCHIVLIPGNHDINNHQATHFNGGPRQGQAMSATITSPQAFINAYRDISYGPALNLYKESLEFRTYLNQVNESYQRLPLNQYYAHGYGSYVYRVVPDLHRSNQGLTIIALDSCQYSVDATQERKDNYQETAGRVTASQMLWVVKQAEAAKERQDAILLLSHHAFVPHFHKQDLYFKEYLISNWDKAFESEDDRIDGKKPADILADFGIHFMFSGHMHAQDIAQWTSLAGNRLYDIETGSIVSYPLPLRHLVLNNQSQADYTQLSLNIKTDYLKELTYRDRFKVEQVVDNLQAHSSGDIVTPELLAAVAGHELAKLAPHKFSLQVLLGRSQWPNQLVDQMEQVLEERKVPLPRKQIQAFIEDVLAQFNRKILHNKGKLEEIMQALATGFLDLDLGLKGGYTICDLANYVYKCHLKGDESQEDWVKESINNLSQTAYMKDLVTSLLPTLAKVIDQSLADIKVDASYLEMADRPLNNLVLRILLASFFGNKLGPILHYFGLDSDRMLEGLDRIYQEEVYIHKLLAKWGAYLADLMDCLTSEDQLAYAPYAYKEDNHTTLMVEYSRLAKEESSLSLL